MNYLEELEKIDQYLLEIQKSWVTNPEWTQSIHFFQRWEQICQPLPFYLPINTYLFPQSSVQWNSLTEKSRAMFTWHAEEECAGLLTEHQHVTYFYPVHIDSNGHPYFGEPKIEESSPDTVSFSDRLEFMMDIVALFRHRWPSRNIMRIHKREYLELVDQLTQDYDPKMIRLMQQLRIHQIHRLIALVTKDMAQDELSPQLVLPLGGSYSTSTLEDQPSNPKTSSNLRFMYEQTPYQVNLLIRILLEANRHLAEIERNLIFPLKDATLITKDRSDPILRLPLNETLDLREGDTLLVREGDAEHGPSVGRLQILIHDRNALICRLRFKNEVQVTPKLESLYATSLRSSTDFVIQVLQTVYEEFQRQQRFPTTTLNSIFGLDSFIFREVVPPQDAPQDLDPSQLRAWSNAVHPANPFILIQGPPGTGKSHLCVRIIEDLLKQDKRILLTAPSHIAVDNLCQKLLNYPLIRVGKDPDRIAPHVKATAWSGDLNCIQRSKQKQKRKEIIFAGTPLGLVFDGLLQMDCREHGLFDVLIFDEAGMASMDLFLIIASLAHRCILVGDHQQLPPFPWPESVIKKLETHYALLRKHRAFLCQSPLQWLVEERQAPIYLLNTSYRCQNPRLLRFCSARFYNAIVRTYAQAEYFQLSYEERKKVYPPESLQWWDTSMLAMKLRHEKMIVTGRTPGYANLVEAELIFVALEKFLERYPLQEISIITPYRSQVACIRQRGEQLFHEFEKWCSTTDWEDFLSHRVATVDSFQGGESDVIIISYVRSNPSAHIGFIDDLNRLNVIHTRARKEMLIIGDLECLKKGGRNQIFIHLAKALLRDGVIKKVSEDDIRRILPVLRNRKDLENSLS